MNNIIDFIIKYPKGNNLIALVNHTSKKVIITRSSNIYTLLSIIVDKFYKILDYQIDELVILEKNLYEFSNRLMTPYIDYHTSQYEEQGYTIVWKNKVKVKVRCTVEYYEHEDHFRVLLISNNGTKETVGVFGDMLEAYEWARQYYHKSKNPFKYRVLANNINTRISCKLTKTHKSIL